MDADACEVCHGKGECWIVKTDVDTGQLYDDIDSCDCCGGLGYLIEDRIEDEEYDS